MKPQEYRTSLIDSLRKFDAWLWRDRLENPSEYVEEAPFEHWHNMFIEFMKGDHD